MNAAMRLCVCLLLLVSASACGGGRLPPKDPGPPPLADHQQQVRDLVERLLDAKYRLDGPSTYRFDAPAPGRVARWHFEPQIEGQSHQFGYEHGWCVEFRVTPSYVGYPAQPESHRMAFYAGGQLRGIFTTGLRNAPLELDKWSACWVDESWQPARLAQPPR